MADRIDIDLDKPQAFLSYARADDEFLGGAISRLRKDIEEAVPYVSGKSFRIFQDKDGIGFGQDWLDRIEETLRQVRFLMPILTPRYFASEPCRAEAFRFLEYEKAAGRNDLILPLYVQDTPSVGSVECRSSDKLAIVIAKREYSDWRELIHAPADSPDHRRAVIALAEEISEAVSREKKQIGTGSPIDSVQPRTTQSGASKKDAQITVLKQQNVTLTEEVKSLKSRLQSVPADQRAKNQQLRSPLLRSFGFASLTLFAGAGNWMVDRERAERLARDAHRQLGAATIRSAEKLVGTRTDARR